MPTLQKIDRDAPIRIGGFPERRQSWCPECLNIRGAAEATTVGSGLQASYRCPSCHLLWTGRKNTPAMPSV